MKYNDKSVQNDIKHFPFKVINKDGQPRVKVEVHGEDKTFTPEEISAMVLGSECFRSFESVNGPC